MKTEAEKLLQKAKSALDSAWAPHSGYPVGAAIMAEDGAVFSGCNIENSSYGLTMCAERVALFSGVAAGRRKFLALAVVARGAGDESFPYPCGACRQVLSEFCGKDMTIYAADLNYPPDYRTLSLNELLPLAFRMRKTGGDP